MSEANHYWWEPWLHNWVAVSARDRFEPFRDPETLVIHDNLGSRKTDILYRCACGKVKTKTVRGAWSFAEVRGEAKEGV